ncbi:divalent-cation tolerance protein CutA [Chloroflexota bacterium]
MKYQAIYVTTRDEDEARRIGRVLVTEGLAAGANIHPVKSIYRWRGEIKETAEAVMIVKTRAELVDKLIKRVTELHSYEVPGIMSLPIETGNPDYLNWITEVTG